MTVSQSSWSQPQTSIPATWSAARRTTRPTSHDAILRTRRRFGTCTGTAGLGAAAASDTLVSLTRAEADQSGCEPITPMIVSRLGDWSIEDGSDTERRIRLVSNAPTTSGREDLKSTTYEFFILAVSILSIVNLALYGVLPFRSQSWWLVAYVDIALTLIFLVDFVFRLLTATTKRSYLLHGGGIFDFLGCLPGLGGFRLFRSIRAIRLVRRLGGPRVVGEPRDSPWPRQRSC